MTTWELLGYGTDVRYAPDVRYRSYTTSATTASMFNRIPKIQWQDSGHGIVFSAKAYSGRKKPNVYAVEDYVREHMDRLRAEAKVTAPKTRSVKLSAADLRALTSAIERVRADDGVNYEADLYLRLTRANESLR